MDRSRTELLIGAVYRLLEGCRTIAVGNSSPIPGSAALLLRAKRPETRVLMLGSKKHNAFTDGGRELFDCAAQGRIDAFFLGGGQIDGQGNINLVGLGPYPQDHPPLSRLVRLGLSLLRRAARDPVPRGAHGAGDGAEGRLRQRAGRLGAGGLPAGRAARAGHRALRLRLRQGASGASASPASIPARASKACASTPASISMWRRMSAPRRRWPHADLDLLRGRVAGEIAETYPRFARALFGAEASAAQ